MIREIELGLLRPHPEQCNYMKPEMLRKLRRHIEETGNYEPLTVRPHYMTSLINRGFQRHELLLPDKDIQIEDQFTTHTYTLVNGKVIYSKGNDHIVDAVRCAMLVRDQQRLDEMEVIVPTVRPVWTDPIFW